ncbi:MAG TPA: thioesterase family protein [Gordonia sp. (in: high G+C Gram-positive bacteria)]|uniref:acyl-CoA thioesterase n=1 Tax=unclassified Gordonia (in: high G+C Gram-positive bacteria) TaxID=2657482 RepID=UPI000FADD678|nr:MULTISPECIES: thioesterase family protein [unclassified Gordonia (in: high G+C Gram-positive bacteria)]RUP37236.1 MAG: thioesterase family protein [Gordonia sp. (in: high G+C Gram-positive bacteria)]HNP56272.1 thioesterase family protein [Gordonia sp. (in: high G+C Gram-positive bacteria)]HRC52092.1 thioesterase family protein [Gordonia sp. (in: high G+C Gram-positive bacteria)]
MTHVFDEAIAVDARPDGVFHATTHPAYGNMVGPFGGITAATVLNALLQHPDVLGQPLALTINFAAPVADGTWDLHTRIERTNRTNQHWTFTISQDGATVSTGSAVFGIRRETWGDTEVRPPAADPATIADTAPVDFPDFIAWARNYDKRFVVGELVYESPNNDSTSTLWLRDLPERPLDYPALTSMSDAFFPRVFLRHGAYMPAGTITMTTYFHASPDELAAQGSDYVLGTARAQRFSHGHFDQYAQLWGGETLLATSHQLVYFKDPQG